ncbi:transposase [Streptomyces sp. NPDC056580]|uniref:helix-turn-helix domain-containing protein n=1 Tax=Streptomyces sp. NPDC056580 TaxID=3345872 RepID=UPI003679865B
MAEGRKLQRISRSAKDPVKLRRAIVVLMSAQGQTVKDITTLMQVGEEYVRDVIHAAKERGFDALDPKWSGGRPAPGRLATTWNWSSCRPTAPG